MAEISDLEAKVVQILQQYDKTSEERFARLEGQLEIVEKLVATLIQGYAEVAAMIESLIATVVNSSEEQRDEFYAALKKSRSDMIDLFKQSHEATSPPQDKFVATAQQPDR